MRSYFTALIAFIVLLSCDDGDIIVTDLDFEDVTVQRCTDFDYVFFKVNNDNNETLALQIVTTDSILAEEGTYIYNLGGNNSLSYRRLDGPVTGSEYFCNPVPPASPDVEEEFTSEAGVVNVVTLGDLDDEDGILGEEEGENDIIPQDTDEDGIPDYIDFDDDGDNVRTVDEGVVFNDDGTINLAESLDTDGDGILNYLDNDDDGDGVLTINEDTDGDLNPANDRPDLNTDPAYLDNTATLETIATAYRRHEYFLKNIEVTINLSNLAFVNEAGDEVIRDRRIIFFGNFTGAPDVSKKETPEL